MATIGEVFFFTNFCKNHFWSVFYPKDCSSSGTTFFVSTRRNNSVSSGPTSFNFFNIFFLFEYLFAVKCFHSPFLLLFTFDIFFAKASLRKNSLPSASNT